MAEVRFLQGNEAVFLGALAAGARFYAGYPITPSSEIAEMAARELPGLGGVFVQMEDELASMAAIIGASLAGEKSFTATSGPGFSLMQENLGVAWYTEAPCVIINVQRFGPSTGMATWPAQGDVMQARWGTHGDHGIICLCPSSVQECYDLAVQAFNLAEHFCSPVVLLSDEIIGHMREKVFIPDQVPLVNRKRPEGFVEGFEPYRPDEDGLPTLPLFGDPYILHATSTTHDFQGVTTSSPQVAEALNRRLVEKIARGKREITAVKMFGPAQARVTLIAYGCTARASRAALEESISRGWSVNMLQLATLWPFPEEEVRRIAGGSERVIVAEMNLGQLALEVERVLHREIIRVNRTDGQLITPREILSKVEEVL